MISGMKATNKPDIDQRAKQLLKLLINRYIAEGNPVASSKLAQDASIQLSSATVRNIMSELEEQGFLYSPHISAGRVPTVQGYRFFVNSLLHSDSLQDLNLAGVQRELNAELSMSELLTTTSSLLSNVTKMAGIVSLPKRKKVLLKHIEFLPLSSRRILCILVLNDREVENRIIHTDKAFLASELQQAANFLNQHCAGKPLSKNLRQQLLDTMRQYQQDMETLLSAAIQAAEASVNEKQQQADFVLQGHEQLLQMAQHGNIDGLKTLFEAFREKQGILQLLDKCLDAQGMQIFIGEESGFAALGDYAVVTAPYSNNGEVLGALAVIGPTRMQYERVIPLVDVTAKLLSRVLGDS